MSFYRSHLKKPEFQAEFTTTPYAAIPEKTDVYAYQTEDSDFIKFGISRSHEERAARAGAHEKDRYLKHLYHVTTNTRYEAETVERLLKQRLDTGRSARLRSVSTELTSRSEQEVIAAIDQAWDYVQSKGAIEIRKDWEKDSFKLFWRLAHRVYRGLAFTRYLYVYTNSTCKDVERLKPRYNSEPSFHGYVVRIEDQCSGWEFTDFVDTFKDGALGSREVLDAWGVDVSQFKGF